MLRPLAIVLTAVPCALAAADDAEIGLAQPSWGSIDRGPSGSHGYVFTVRRRPPDGRLIVPTPFPHIVRCSIDGADRRRAVDFEFNRDASNLTLIVPESQTGNSIGRVYVETSEESQQMPDGRIVFSALDARVVGERAKLETHPGNHRIGFWTDDDDSVVWNYNATRWGMYDVCLTYSTASPAGTRVSIEMSKAKSDGVAVEATLESTGSWYRYTTIELGRFYLAAAGKHQLTVKCLEKVGLAVMNLKSVILVPACEGSPPVQAADGVVTLHGRDATIHGTKLRWEPAAKKQTIGYWTQVSDAATWTFELSQPGTYDVEVLQGCGTGQGGSRMIIDGHGEPIAWQVEETGHFQNFKPRIVGRFVFPEGGRQQITVKPTEIAAQAACDIRQIRLIPIKK